MSMNIPALAVMFGIISTTVLHIAKAMEQQGIEIFDQQKAKLQVPSLTTSVAGTTAA